MRPENTAALVLAAGLSSRMGQFKPLIAIDGRRVIEHVIDGIRAADITRILVVVGHQADRLLRVLSDNGAEGVVNPAYRGEMFSSLKIGVARLSSADSAFFVLPGDMPYVRPQTYRQLLTAFDPDRMDILRPRRGGRFGHPVLISTARIPDIIAYSGDGGLRKLIRARQWHMADLDCRDPGILIDLDHPEDLRRARP